MANVASMIAVKLEPELEAIVQQLEDREDYDEAARCAKNPGRIYSSEVIERELGFYADAEDGL